MSYLPSFLPLHFFLSSTLFPLFCPAWSTYFLSVFESFPLAPLHGAAKALAAPLQTRWTSVSLGFSFRLWRCAGALAKWSGSKEDFQFFTNLRNIGAAGVLELPGKNENWHTTGDWITAKGGPLLAFPGGRYGERGGEAACSPAACLGHRWRTLLLL